MVIVEGNWEWGDSESKVFSVESISNVSELLKNNLTKFFAPLSHEAQLKLNSGEKISVIVGAMLSGVAKEYYEMVSKDPDDVGRQRDENPEKIDSKEKLAEEQSSKIKSEIINKLEPSVAI